MLTKHNILVCNNSKRTTKITIAFKITSIARNSFFLSHTRDISVGKIKTGQVQKKLYFLHVIKPLFSYVLEFLWEMKKTDSVFDKFNKL